jgi:hypothetical protein
MSSNRLKYDVCATKTYIKQSVKPINYTLDPVRFEHCSRCAPEVGIVGGTNVTHVKGNLVDLESSLFGITFPATKCPEYENGPIENNTLISKEYTKLDKHSPINVSLERNLPICDLTHSHIPNAPEPPLNLSKCTR